MPTTLKPSRIITHRETILAVCDEDNSIWQLTYGRKLAWKELPKIERPDPPTPEEAEWLAAWTAMPRGWQQGYRYAAGDDAKRAAMRAEALWHYRQLIQERNA